MVNERTQTGWGAFVAVWILSSLTFTFWLFTNIVFGVIIGALTGWLLSFIFLGQWIIDGLSALGLKTHIGELHNIAAAAGFLSGFMKFSFGPARSSQAEAIK